ncbi:MAG: GNAT family N-acetyltransferase [Anaerolineales bacterium]|nr:GNAT family N-acetyltransferase [Anaerolineales bacterium]
MPNVLREVPDQIETERLVIRSPMPGDGAPLREAVLASQAELRPWLDWAVDVPDADAYEERVRQGRARYITREDLWLLLLLKETGAIIGGSGLHRIDWNVPCFEIGYWLHTAYTGRGYVTEAVRAVEALAFEQLGARRVAIHVDARNARSIAVVRRLGYPQEGVLRQYQRGKDDGRLRDILVFARIRPEP